MLAKVFARHLFVFEVSVSLDHDLLSLGRPCSVDGFCEETDGAGAHSDVLDQANATYSRLCGYVGHSLQIFFQRFADTRDVKILLRRRGSDDRPRYVLREATHFYRIAGYVQFRHVSQKPVHQASARRMLAPFGGRGHGAGITGFVKMDHFLQLIFHVRGAGRSVVICNQGSCSDKDISDTGFASTVARPVIIGKNFDKSSGELVLTAHEDVLPRNEDVVKNHVGFVAAETRVPYIDVSAFKLSRVAGLTTVDVRDTLAVRRGHEKLRRNPCPPRASPTSGSPQPSEN